VWSDADQIPDSDGHWGTISDKLGDMTSGNSVLHDRAATGVSLSGLVKTFRSPAGPVHAVRGIDIDIAPGETLALLGPNGAGKSTTIDMLLGLLKPDAGEVRVFGMTPSDAISQGAIGGMLQTGAVLADLHVRELIEMMCSLYPKPLSVDETLHLARISDIADRKTNKLSGGQTQRVRFAVAMVSDPDLLVLDEPTVSMDVESRHMFWETLRAFTARGKTVLFATHYLDEADANAGRIVLMARGKVVADGAATEIKAVAGGRTIRATLPDVDIAILRSIDGVRDADLRGDAIILNCSDSDRAVRELLQRFPEVRDLEITGAGLEAAFMQLTVDHDGEPEGVNETEGSQA
jgi:ABC-2 type transport system ATP-binding protein